MKILQIKAILTSTGGGVHYNYPKEYDAQKITVLCYEHVGDKNAIVDRGNVDEYLIGVVSDEDAVQFLKSDMITELTQINAIEKGRRWRPQVDKIVDVTAVLLTLAKSARNEQLTQEELNVITPEKAVAGINKSELFDDLLVRHL